MMLAAVLQVHRSIIIAQMVYEVCTLHALHAHLVPVVVRPQREGGPLRALSSISTLPRSPSRTLRARRIVSLWAGPSCRTPSS
eukprot:5837113-Pyramimonas_sp.AAC.1